MRNVCCSGRVAGIVREVRICGNVGRQDGRSCRLPLKLRLRIVAGTSDIVVAHGHGVIPTKALLLSSVLTVASLVVHRIRGHGRIEVTWHLLRVVAVRAVAACSSHCSSLSRRRVEWCRPVVSIHRATGNRAARLQGILHVSCAGGGMHWWLALPPHAVGIVHSSERVARTCLVALACRVRRGQRRGRRIHEGGHFELPGRLSRPAMFCAKSAWGAVFGMSCTRKSAWSEGLCDPGDTSFEVYDGGRRRTRTALTSFFRSRSGRYE